MSLPPPVIGDAVAQHAGRVGGVAGPLREVPGCQQVGAAVEGEHRRTLVRRLAQAHAGDRQGRGHVGHPVVVRLAGPVGQPEGRHGPGLGAAGRDGLGVDAVLGGVLLEPHHAVGGVVVGVDQRGGHAQGVAGRAAGEARPVAVLHRHRDVAPLGEGLGVGRHVAPGATRAEPAAVEPHDGRAGGLGVARRFVDVGRQLDGVARSVGHVAEHDVPGDRHLVEDRVEVAVDRRGLGRERQRHGDRPVAVVVTGHDLAVAGPAVDRVAFPGGDDRGDGHVDDEAAVAVDVDVSRCCSGRRGWRRR